MIEPRKAQVRMKSRIPVMKVSSLENKENASYVANRKGIVNTTKQHSSVRRTLSTKKNVYLEKNAAAKSEKAKSVPNFEKLHKKWESQLAKGKASVKRPNTQTKPFNLSKKTPKKNLEDESGYEFLSDSTDEFTDDDFQNKVSPVSSEVRKKDCVCETTESKLATINAGESEFKVPTSVRTICSSVKKVRIPPDQDLFDFKPDNAALQSILNNVGVDEGKIRATPNKRTPSSLYVASPYKQKRTSIYYTGPRPDRPLSGFEQRLIMRRASAMTEIKTSKSDFEPSKTLIGIQEVNSKFAVTPIKEPSSTKSYIPDQNILQKFCEGNLLSCSETNDTSPVSYHGTPATDISWAEKLKSYSQLPRSGSQPPSIRNRCQDTKTLVAELEEDVYRNLLEIKLVNESSGCFEEQPNECDSSKRISSSVLSENSKLIQRPGGRSSLNRQLFASPTVDVLENQELKTKCSDLLASCSHSIERSTKGILSTYDRRQKDDCDYVFPVKPIKYQLATNPASSHTFQDQEMKKSAKSPVTHIVFPSSDTQRSFEEARITHFSRRLKTTTEKPIAIPTSFSENPKPEILEQTVNRSSAFSAVRLPETNIAKRTNHTNSTNLESADTKSEIVVPTPRRQVPYENEPYTSGDFPQRFRVGFVSHQREIIRDALMKSRNHAQEILLDAEVSLYARKIEHLKKIDRIVPRLENPLAKIFSKGDDMHFLPVKE